MLIISCGSTLGRFSQSWATKYIRNLLWSCIYINDYFFSIQIWVIYLMTSFYFRIIIQFKYVLCTRWHVSTTESLFSSNMSYVPDYKFLLQNHCSVQICVMYLMTSLYYRIMFSSNISYVSSSNIFLDIY